MILKKKTHFTILMRKIDTDLLCNNSFHHCKQFMFILDFLVKKFVPIQVYFSANDAKNAGSKTDI